MKLIKTIFRQAFRFVNLKKSYILELQPLKLNTLYNDDLVFEVYNKDNISAFNLTSIDYTTHEISLSKQWLKIGNSLVVGSTNAIPVVHCWVSKTEFDMGLNEFSKLPKKSIYVYKVFIDKNYRRRGLLNRLYKFIESKYSKNMVKCYIWISNKNKISIKAHLKVGFKPSKNLVSLKIFSLKRSFFTDFSGSP